MSSSTVSSTSICCGRATSKIGVAIRYAPGSVVYSLPKAVVGLVEAIFIKRVIVNKNYKTTGQYVPIYVDSFNSFWNEEELITESEAVDLALTYLERQEALLEQICPQ